MIIKKITNHFNHKLKARIILEKLHDIRVASIALVNLPENHTESQFYEAYDELVCQLEQYEELLK